MAEGEGWGFGFMDDLGEDEGLGVGFRDGRGIVDESGLVVVVLEGTAETLCDVSGVARLVVVVTKDIVGGPEVAPVIDGVVDVGVIEPSPLGTPVVVVPTDPDELTADVARPVDPPHAASASVTQTPSTGTTTPRRGRCTSETGVSECITSPF